MSRPRSDFPKVDCPDCKGNGYREEPCTRCRNFGGRDCGTCGNSGVRPLGPCDRCKKTGKVAFDDMSDDELREAGLLDEK